MGKFVNNTAEFFEYCKENEVNYADYYSAMVDNKGGLKVPEYTSIDDLVHPNKAGYKVMEEITQCDCFKIEIVY